MNRFVVLWCFAVIPFSAWSLECLHCDATVSQCEPGTNKSGLIECTQPNSRCYRRKITKIDEEDRLDQSCTNEEGCGIMINACANSGDCTTTCCQKDRCNNMASGIATSTCTLICLLVTALVLWYEVS